MVHMEDYDIRDSMRVPVTHVVQAYSVVILHPSATYRKMYTFPRETYILYIKHNTTYNAVNVTSGYFFP